MNNKSVFWKIISVFLFWTVPIVTLVVLVWSYLVNYKTLKSIPEFQKDSLIFANYTSSTIGDGSTGTIEALGTLNSNRQKQSVEIGYYDSSGDNYKNVELDSLIKGNILLIWYDKKDNISQYRFSNEEKSDLYDNFLKHVIPLYLLYLIYVYLTVKMYKKYKKISLEGFVNSIPQN